MNRKAEIEMWKEHELLLSDQLNTSTQCLCVVVMCQLPPESLINHLNRVASFFPGVSP